MKILRALILIVCFAFLTNAQTANLSGTIYDQQGAVIPNIKIIAIADKDKRTFETKTDASGQYSLKLTDGIYKIKVVSDSFKPVVLKRFRVVTVSKGQMNLDFSLNGKVISG